MTTDKQWQEMLEEHELAYFRADLALSLPQSDGQLDHVDLVGHVAGVVVLVVVLSLAPTQVRAI